MQYIGMFLGLLILAMLAFVLFSKRFEGYRTLIAGWLATIMGALLPLATEIVGYLQGLDWRQYVLGADRNNTIILGIVGGLGVLMIVLRYMTKAPVGEKPSA